MRFLSLKCSGTIQIPPDAREVFRWRSATLPRSVFVDVCGTKAHDMLLLT